MTVEEELALRDRALAGDGAALRGLCALLTPVVQARVAGVLLRMRAGAGIDRRQEARDLTQEVFLRLFERDGRLLRGWDPARGASLKGFVGLVAQRQAISALRGQAENARLSDDLGEVAADDPGAASAAPDRRAASREELALVLERLQAQLSPLGIELFYRMMVHDEDVAEITRATGMTANALYIWRTRLLALTRKIEDDLRRERGSGPILLEPQATRRGKAVAT